ncbi:MAG TPA: ATP-binding protein [Fimbriimonadaceae bacterium]|nr:ATP-binding protein [Fimbriimonadaceae bacterium]
MPVLEDPGGGGRSATISLESLVDSIPDVILSVGGDGKISYANAAASARSGFQLVGTPFSNSSASLGLTAATPGLMRALERRESFEAKVPEPSTNECIEVRGMPFEDGLAIFARRLGEFDDPADSDADLQRLNETLNERVRERTAELEAANSELEGFTYSVSHDLRGPLRAIISTSKILLEDSKGKLEESERELLERQAAAAKKVGSLIDELLKLSRIARQEMLSEPLDLAMIAADVAQELKGEGHADHISFDIQPNLPAKGDARLLRFVFLNLLENACKFTPGSGCVWVGKKDGAFFVRDEGIGFDMAYAHKLFLPFERLVNESEYPGTGIGLANVQRIVHRHGGRVWAESKPGHGSTFYFTLA